MPYDPRFSMREATPREPRQKTEPFYDWRGQQLEVGDIVVYFVSPDVFEGRVVSLHRIEASTPGPGQEIVVGVMPHDRGRVNIDFHHVLPVYPDPSRLTKVEDGN